jgi:glycosyltransferase involved in cell wall biosynthesis
MTEHLVLMFAYHFPPENSIGGARPFRFAKYLSRLGYTCRVFTAADQTGRNDPNTVYVPDPFVTFPRRNIKWQLERAIRKLFMPGALGTQWSHSACRAAKAHLRAHPGARVTIFSTFPPLGPHLAAWQLARSENLPWIADFRDPFPDWSEFSVVRPHHRRVFQWLERAIARRADVVIANTDGAMVKWRDEFPSLNGKVHVIWNGFDPEERIGPLPLPPRNYKSLSHVGHLYHNRTATPILESIARLIAAGRLSPARIRVRLVGSAEPGVLPSQQFLDRARDEGWLDLVTERIPQREALQISRSSDSLLLLQPQSTTQVPGKLFEYLQIGRPILAFVQPASPTERLLKRSGVPHRCVYPGSAPEDIDEVVAGFFDLPSTPVAPTPEFEQRFNAENQTGMLDAMIRSLHEEPLREIVPSPRRSADAKRSTTNRRTDVHKEVGKAAVNLGDRA